MFMLASLPLAKLKLLTANAVSAMTTATKVPAGVIFIFPAGPGRRFSTKSIAAKMPPYTAANSSSESGSAPPRCGHSTQCSCHSTLAASSAKIKARAHT